MSVKAFDSLLDEIVARKELVLQGEIVALPEFNREINPQDAQQIEKISNAYLKAGTQAKNRREMLAGLGIDSDKSDPILQVMFEQGTLIKLNEESFLHRDIYHRTLELLIQHFAENQTLTLAEFRDLIESGRKQTQAILEYWDRLKYVLRKGDQRVAWKLPDSKSNRS
jgi:selenocysteine-specific elongation factor